MIYILPHILQQELIITIKSLAFISQILTTQGFKDNLHILDLQLQELLPLGMVIRVLGIEGKDYYKVFSNREDLRFSAARRSRPSRPGNFSSFFPLPARSASGQPHHTARRREARRATPALQQAGLPRPPSPCRSQRARERERARVIPLHPVFASMAHPM
jgi:hypothetical protein